MKFRIVVVVILGLFVIGCGESKKSEPGATEAPTTGAPAEPGSGTEGSASAKPTGASGPAVELAIADGANIDPCALLDKKQLTGLIGEPKEYRRSLVPTTLGGAKPDRIVARCKIVAPGVPVTIEVGGADTMKGRGETEEVQNVEGVGDQLRVFRDPMSKTHTAVLHVGSRIATVDVGSTAKKHQDTVVKVAKALAPKLADPPAYTTEKGDAVGAPAVNPCELLDETEVALVTGAVEVIEIPSTWIGSSQNRNDLVDCSWASSVSDDKVTVGFKVPFAFEHPGATLSPQDGPDVAGAPSKTAETFVGGYEILVDRGDYTLSVAVDAKGKRDELVPKLVELATKASARL